MSRALLSPSFQTDTFQTWRGGTDKSCRMTAGIGAQSALSRKCNKVVTWRKCCWGCGFQEWLQINSLWSLCQVIKYWKSNFRKTAQHSVRKWKTHKQKLTSILKSEGAVIKWHLFSTLRDSDSAHSKLFFFYIKLLFQEYFCCLLILSVTLTAE